MRNVIFVLWLLYINISYSMGPKINWEKAIDKAIEKYGLTVEPQLISYFSQADISYPPKEIALLAFKSEKNVELWAKDSKKDWTYIHRYPLTGYSGHLGPKLKENDGQIPEGIYQLVNFNPFSSWHLSMMVNYPNAFDQLKAKQDHRRKPGNNIFLHGKNLSAGCLAIGNKAIDQLFTLVRRVGLKNSRIIIAPNDLRFKKIPLSKSSQPRWLPELYQNIKRALKPFKKPLAPQNLPSTTKKII